MNTDRNTFRSELGRKLRQARESLGLSLAGVGELTGIGRTEIHRYEIGDREPSAWALSRLIPVLEADAKELLANRLE